MGRDSSPPPVADQFRANHIRAAQRAEASINVITGQADLSVSEWLKQVVGIDPEKTSISSPTQLDKIYREIVRLMDPSAHRNILRQFGLATDDDIKRIDGEADRRAQAFSLSSDLTRMQELKKEALETNNA